MTTHQIEELLFGGTPLVKTYTNPPKYCVGKERITPLKFHKILEKHEDTLSMNVDFTRNVRVETFVYENN